MLHSRRRNCVNVTLSQQHVTPALQLDLATIFGLEQDPVFDFESANVRPNGYNVGPRQLAPDRRSCGDHDPTARPTLAVSVHLNQYAIMQQLDRKGSCVFLRHR